MKLISGPTEFPAIAAVIVVAAATAVTTTTTTTTTNTTTTTTTTSTTTTTTSNTSTTITNTTPTATTTVKCQNFDGIDSLWLSDDRWRHKSELTLVEVLACCLTAQVITRNNVD